MKKRKASRSDGHNYSMPGYYVVEFNARDRYPFFGNIIDGVMHLSRIGKLAERVLRTVPDHHDNVDLIEYVVMPDHIHAIIYVGGREEDVIDVPHNVQVVPRVVGQCKAAVTRLCNRHCGGARFGWQDSFYDCVARSEEALAAHMEYIQGNPRRWEAKRVSAKTLRARWIRWRAPPN